MSARWSTPGSAATCSGAMYAGVPIIIPAPVAVPEIAIRDARLIEKTHYPLTLIVVPGVTRTALWSETFDKVRDLLTISQ